MAKEKLNWEDEQVRHDYRHTASHIMAQAIKRLWPDTKLAIGPAIDNGFYYDLDSEHKFTEEDFPKIQKEMKKIVQANYPLERFELPREEAIQFMEEREEPYKVELIQDLPEDAVISFYKQGDFVDLCAGPHMESTGKIKAYIQFCLAMSGWAIETNDNRKFFKDCSGYTQEQKAALMMRVLVNRLGMKGPEFKTARLHLTSAFTSNAQAA